MHTHKTVSSHAGHDESERIVTPTPKVHYETRQLCVVEKRRPKRQATDLPEAQAIRSSSSVSRQSTVHLRPLFNKVGWINPRGWFGRCAILMRQAASLQC